MADEDFEAFCVLFGRLLGYSYTYLIRIDYRTLQFFCHIWLLTTSAFPVCDSLILYCLIH